MMPIRRLVAQRIAFCLAAGVPMPALAQTKPDGCFIRTYSADHMKRNPSQQIRSLVVRIGQYYPPDVSFGAEARVRGKRQPWRAGGHCKAAGTGWTCQPDTDGDPVISIESQGVNMRFVIPIRLKLVDDRTGPDLNEVVVAGLGDRVFVLSPTSARACRVE
jgi:hypothetical protein